ncbi:hypothetical protein MBLNU230_g0503t1 [Neophaeotheca triangularis]
MMRRFFTITLCTLLTLALTFILYWDITKATGTSLIPYTSWYEAPPLGSIVGGTDLVRCKDDNGEEYPNADDLFALYEFMIRPENVRSYIGEAAFPHNTVVAVTAVGHFLSPNISANATASFFYSYGGEEFRVRSEKLSVIVDIFRADQGVPDTRWPPEEGWAMMMGEYVPHDDLREGKWHVRLEVRDGVDEDGEADLQVARIFCVEGEIVYRRP